MERLRLNSAGPNATESLHTILDLHYRYRFDPAGLSDQDRLRLRDLAHSWLAEMRHLSDRSASA
jgi:hypothetical protein